MFSRLLILAAILFLTVAPLSAAEHIVRVITDYEKLRMVFEPASLNIAPGDSVTWVNEKS
jgi:plastocyanin